MKFWKKAMGLKSSRQLTDYGSVTYEKCHVDLNLPEDITVSGEGLKNGILGAFDSRFIVETGCSGAGDLTVNIKGPKGFHLEMLRDDEDDPNPAFTYNPTLPGTYSISITWCHRHIAGSPFEISISDS